MKKYILLLVMLFSFAASFAQVNCSACRPSASGSPCSFGLNNFGLASVSVGTLNYTQGSCWGSNAGGNPNSGATAGPYGDAKDFKP